jgi:hypothetical protein
MEHGSASEFSPLPAPIPGKIDVLFAGDRYAQGDRQAKRRKHLPVREGTP